MPGTPLDIPSSVCYPLGVRGALGQSTDLAGYRRQ